MSSAFTFSFSGDDIEDDDPASQKDAMDVDALEQNVGRDLPALLPVQVHSLAEVLSTLPSLLSFTHLPIPTTLASALHIPRRAHFDILTQLHAEVEIDTQPATNHSQQKRSESDSDILPHIYEGGLKTWESSIDLASYLANTWRPSVEGRVDVDIIELGCGTAIPSLVILQRYMLGCRAQRTGGKDEGNAANDEEKRDMRFFFCDYNRSVLEAATAANVLLNLMDGGVIPTNHPQSVLPLPATNHMDMNNDQDQDIDTPSPPILAAVPSTLANSPYHTSLTFVAGAWGPQLVEAIYPTHSPIPSAPATTARREVLILTSETIYAPAQQDALVHTILGLLRSGGGGKKGGRALVAAKRLYFGVGGGVEAFSRAVEGKGAEVRVVWDSGGMPGVGRVILEVRWREGG